MGGPAAGVLLRRVPQDDEILAPRAWLATAADFYDASDSAYAKDGSSSRPGQQRWATSLPEADVLEESRCFSLIPQAEYSGDSCYAPADWVRISYALGWMPTCELSVGIECSRPKHHKVLGWLCAELATRFDGMIDLGGTLPLPNRDQWGSVGLAGKVVETVYDLEHGRTAAVHIVDAEFLRFWLLQPQFHMIK